MLWLRPKALMTFLRDLVPAFNSRLIKQLELVLGNYGFSLKLSKSSLARWNPETWRSGVGATLGHDRFETANFVTDLQVFQISVGSVVLFFVAAGPRKHLPKNDDLNPEWVGKTNAQTHPQNVARVVDLLWMFTHFEATKFDSGFQTSFLIFPHISTIHWPNFSINFESQFFTPLWVDPMLRCAGGCTGGRGRSGWFDP